METLCSSEPTTPHCVSTQTTNTGTFTAIRTSYLIQAKWSQCLIKLYAIKTCGKVEVQLHAFLSSTQDIEVWGHLHTPNPGRGPGTHWIRCWLDSRAVWMRWQREKFLRVPGFERRSSSRSLVIILTQLTGLLNYCKQKHYNTNECVPA
jgi:hypothetical protein